MYLDHFGIKEFPFTLTPNTQFFFGLPSHNEALTVLNTALLAGEGFIKVTGEVGTGKTLVCRKLLNSMPQNFVAAYIPNPYLSPVELRHAVACELQVELPSSSDQQKFTQAIHHKLVEIRKTGKSVVLIIDEAQALPDESIEALRLMTNFETESSKLIQVVLFGQPELNEKIAQPKLRQLRQRITFSYELSPLDADQIYQYANHRMAVAGYNKKAPIFPKSACKSLLKASKGTPRVVNTICHKALMLAYGEGDPTVSNSQVKLAASDTEAAYSLNRSVWLTRVLPAAACVLLSLSLVLEADFSNSYQNIVSLLSGWQK